MARRDDDFIAFVDARSAALLQTARLLAAGDQHAAEDLVQTALEKAYVAWPRIQRTGAQEAYVCSIMRRSAIDRTRQRSRRGEVVTDKVPEVAVHPVGPEDRDTVFALLQELSPRQRAVLVLRYWSPTRGPALPHRSLPSSSTPRSCAAPCRPARASGPATSRPSPSRRRCGARPS